MKNMSMILAALSLGFACGSIVADPARDPKRMVNGQTVDLKPLIQWWPKRHGDRPLAAWAHVTGKIVATNSLGWAVQGVVEDDGKGTGPEGKASRNLRFILKSPPLAELAEFERMRTRLKSLQAERDAVNRDLMSASARLQADAQRRQELRARGYRVRGNGPATRLSEAERRAAQQALRNLDAEIKQVDAAMQKLPNRGDAYQVDCFALKTGEEFRGLPVYDHGFVLR